MKVLKKIWKGIRFGIGILFTIPFLISLFCIKQILDEKEKESKQESDKCDSDCL